MSNETKCGPGECSAGHPQREIAECDGVHCYRPCDEVAREECAARASAPIEAPAMEMVVHITLACNRCRDVRSFDLKDAPLIGSEALSYWLQTEPGVCKAARGGRTCGSSSVSIKVRCVKVDAAAALAMAQAKEGAGRPRAKA